LFEARVKDLLNFHYFLDFSFLSQLFSLYSTQPETQPSNHNLPLCQKLLY
jgi:hypothetical protein